MGITSSTLSLGANLPTEWNYYGCYTDYGSRKLMGPSYVDTENMTQESCVSFCNGNGHPYAGVEYGRECYCGFVIGAGSERKEDTECNFRCPGAADEACGSNFRLSVFYTGLLDHTHTNPGPNGTSRIGCLTDNVHARTLPVLQASEDGMTVGRCTSNCQAAGHSLAGLEFGRECWCGNSLNNNAIVANEGCNMRCAGNSTEFCGGAERLEVYVPNVAGTLGPTSTGAATPICRPTNTATNPPYIVNGGFEQGLANWTAAAYNADLYPFDIMLTNDAIEGCTALEAVPQSRTALSQHVQLSTTLINLQVSHNYTVDLAIGHRETVDRQDAIADPKYTVRLSDRLLDRGDVCGFSSNPCPLTGPNGSTWTALSLPFQADSPTEDLTVYLSWYNGNLDMPLYLDSVVVRPFPDAISGTTNSPGTPSRMTASELLNSRPRTSSTTSETAPAISTPAVETGMPATLNLTCPTPESCPDGPPPIEITNKTLLNSGFEDGLQGWEFFPQASTFEVTLTNQSLEGRFAASVKPRSPNADSERSITLQTSMTNLNSSHEWYTVSVLVGHPGDSSLNDSTPWITMKYRSEVTGDIQRRAGLCGVENALFNGPCELFGAGGALYQNYSMDTRSFYSTDRVYTNSTEMDIELEIVWPVGVPGIPIYVDGMRVWEIEWGTVSR